MKENNIRNSRQELFREMVMGTLVYAVVLGFFEDYTNILSTWSYSVTFATAVVLQILTYITLSFKSIIVAYFSKKEGRKYVVILVFFVWLILFFSKFIFLAVIDFIFGDSVSLSGFFGLLIIIIVMTLAKRFIDLVYDRLS